MNDEQTPAHEEAEAAARGGLVELLDRVADKLGQHMGAAAVFGEPVERDGVTVIPVAQSMIGTGAGGGSSDDAENGYGAGGGAITRPIGYIEIGAVGATFTPLRPGWTSPAVMAAVVLVSLIVARTVLKLAGR